MIDTAYLQPNTAIVCETVDEFKELLIELGALGYTWPNGKAASAELEADCRRYRDGSDAVWISHRVKNELRLEPSKYALEEDVDHPTVVWFSQIQSQASISIQSIDDLI